MQYLSSIKLQIINIWHKKFLNQPKIYKLLTILFNLAAIFFITTYPLSLILQNKSRENANTNIMLLKY